MTQRRKLALVANSTWNIYNFRLNIVQKFEAAGYDVVVIAPVDEYLHYVNRFEHVRHIPLYALSRKGTNPLQDLRLFFELSGIYRREKPDLVLHYTIKPNIFGNLAAAWLGLPSVCAVTGLGYTFLHRGWLQRLTRLLYKISFRFADRVVFENLDDRALFLELGLVQESKSQSVKGCGIDLGHFRPEPSDAGSSRATVFTFIGRLLYDKGIKEYVAAAEILKKQFPDVHFQVLGDLDTGNPASVAESELSAWIQGKTIEYCGATQDVRPFISKSDCIVLPSYREAIPRVIQEAMAMGKPAITTQVAGCREAVEHGKNGLLVPVQNPEALAAAMEAMMHLSAEERTAMGICGRLKAEKEFDEKLIAGEFFQIVETLLTRHASTPHRTAAAIRETR